MNDRSDNQCSHDGTFAYTINARHENQGQQAGDGNQCDIEAQLDISELSVEAFRYDLDKIFSGHHGCIGFYLQCNAYGQNDTADQQGDNHVKIFGGIQPIKNTVHAQVNKHTEAEGDRDLKQVHAQIGLQILACHQERFHYYKEEVQHDGPLADGERREHAQYIRDTCDGRSSQGRFGDKRNAECIDKQGDAEQQVAPEKYLTHISLYYSF